MKSFPWEVVDDVASYLNLYDLRRLRNSTHRWYGWLRGRVERGIAGIPCLLDVRYHPSTLRRSSKALEVVEATVYMGWFKEPVPYLIDHPSVEDDLFGRTIKVDTVTVLGWVSSYPYLRVKVQVDLMVDRTLSRFQTVTVECLGMITRGSLVDNWLGLNNYPPKYHLKCRG